MTALLSSIPFFSLSSGTAPKEGYAARGWSTDGAVQRLPAEGERGGFSKSEAEALQKCVHFRKAGAEEKILRQSVEISELLCYHQ